MRASWRVGSAKMGRMSSKRMPGEGKSGNWRSAARSLILRLASSVVREGWEGDCPETWVVEVASCWDADWDMLKPKGRKQEREKRKKTDGGRFRRRGGSGGGVEQDGKDQVSLGGDLIRCN